jgi:hypothetical protein
MEVRDIDGLLLGWLAPPPLREGVDRFTLPTRSPLSWTVEEPPRPTSDDYVEFVFGLYDDGRGGRREALQVLNPEHVTRLERIPGFEKATR